MYKSGHYYLVLKGYFTKGLVLHATKLNSKRGKIQENVIIIFDAIFFKSQLRKLLENSAKN